MDEAVVVCIFFFKVGRYPQKSSWIGPVCHQVDVTQQKIIGSMWTFDHTPDDKSTVWSFTVENPFPSNFQNFPCLLSTTWVHPESFFQVFRRWWSCYNIFHWDGSPNHIAFGAVESTSTWLPLDVLENNSETTPWYQKWYTPYRWIYSKFPR